MAWKLTSGPLATQTDRSAFVKLDEGLEIALTHNERSTARFSCLPGYIPNLRDEIRIYAQDGTTVLFAGLVYQRQTRSALDRITTEVDCADWSVYGDWCFTDATYAAATTLQVVLNDLVGVMAGFGVTLDTANYTGVAVAAFSWSNKLVTDALRDLSDSTGYIWKFSTTKVVSLSLPGALPAPFNVSDATPHCSTLEWRDSSDKYASKVRLICGPTGIVQTTQTWTANGTATTWVTDFPAVAVSNYVTVGGVQKSLAGTTAFAARCFLGLTINPAVGPVYDPTLNFANNESVTLAGRTYTFKTVLTPAAGEICIQPTGTESFNALICAINNYDGGKGTTWAAATPSPHADIVAYWGKGNEVVCKAKVAGTAGNAYACTTTAAYLKIYGEGNVNLTTFDLGEDATGAQYEFDIPTHTLSVGTDAVPTNGTSIVLVYTASFPFTVTAGSNVVPMVEYVATAPDIMTIAAGQQRADALLAKMSGSQKTIQFMTLESGFETGHALSVILTDRAINVAAAFIQTVQITLVRATWWEYRITAIEGSEYLGSYLDFYRDLGGGSGTAVIGGGGIVTVTGEPIHYLGGSRFFPVEMP